MKKSILTSVLVLLTSLIFSQSSLPYKSGKTFATAISYTASISSTITGTIGISPQPQINVGDSIWFDFSGLFSIDPSQYIYNNGQFCGHPTPYGVKIKVLNNDTLLHFAINGGSGTASPMFNTQVIVTNTTTSTGIKDYGNAVQGKLNVFPNPSTTDVTVEFHSNKEKVEIEVFDIQGRLVMVDTKDRQLGENKVSLHIEDLSQGIYIVRADKQTFKITKL